MISYTKYSIKDGLLINFAEAKGQMKDLKRVGFWEEKHGDDDWSGYYVNG